MTLPEGTVYRAQTKTHEDVFGDCIWKIVEAGLPAPEPQRREAGVNDGVRCELLGGSGPAARPGFSCQDSEAAILRRINEGTVEIIDGDEAARIIAYYKANASHGKPTEPKAGPGGIVEM